MIEGMQFITAEIKRVQDLLDEAGAPDFNEEGERLSMSQRLELYMASVRVLTAKRLS